MSGAVRSAPFDNRSDSPAARANSLKAARNSLLRDDVAAARAQLNAISAAHRDDQQVVELQKEIQERADREQRAAAVAPVETTPGSAQKPVRTSSSAAAKGGHSRDTQLASREYSNRAPGYARNRRPGAAVEAKSGGVGAAGASGTVPMASESAYASPGMKVVRGPGAPATVNTMPLLQQSVSGSDAQSVSPATSQPVQPVQPVQTAPSIPSAPQPEITAQAVMPQPVAQTTVPSAPLLKTDGPKTRAQVRAELARARENGSLPPFGNPDPAGPGGAPSLTIAPRH
jgi:hypothetical protein